MVSEDDPDFSFSNPPFEIGVTQSSVKIKNKFLEEQNIKAVIAQQSLICFQIYKANGD